MADPLAQLLPFWLAKNDDDAATGLRQEFAKRRSIQSARREMAEQYAAVTEAMCLNALGPWGYSYDTSCPKFAEGDIPLIRNAGFAIEETLTAKIGAIDPPLPSMLTDKGSWKDRRQADDLERLVRAEFTQPQAHHANLHELWIAALKLAAGATGLSAVQFYADQDGKVGARIHDTLSMFWDDTGRTEGCITWLPVEDVVELYPDSELDIRAAAADPPAEWGRPTLDGQKMCDYVAVFEGWRTASAKGKRAGKHVVCVSQGAALLVRDYPHQRTPFVWLAAIPHLYGRDGHCMLHHVYQSMRRDNLILSRVDKAINKTNERTTFAAKEDLENPAALTGTDDHVVIWLKDGTCKAPTTESPAGFAAEHLTVADRHHADTFSISGMAESNTQGVRQEGIPSAIGQRYAAALVNERFASIQRRYVQAVAVDSTYAIIQVLCEIFEDDPKLLRLAPGQDTLREVSGALALKGIESLKYVVQSEAVSGNKDNPADRMQSAYEMKQLGILTDEQYVAMQSHGEDLPHELDQTDVQRRWIEWQMHSWMFASDEEFAQPDFYLAPNPGLAVPEATLQVFEGYLEAQMDKLEPDRLDLFLTFIADLGALPPPATPQPAAPAGPGLPVPGAPPAPGFTPLPQQQGLAA